MKKSQKILKEQMRRKKLNKCNKNSKRGAKIRNKFKNLRKLQRNPIKK